jgi:hypothetical protein
MTVRELDEEIETRLMLKPQSAMAAAKIISATTEALGTEVLYAIEGLKGAGRLREIDGILYVQQWPEG